MPWAHELTDAWQTYALRYGEPNDRAWKPFAPEGTPPQYPPDRTIDLRRLRAEIALDVPGKSLTGRAALTFAPIADAVQSLALDAEDLAVSAVACSAETKLGWRNTGKRLELTFDPPLPAEVEATVTIEYAATPKRGLHFIAPDEDHPDKRTEVWSQCFDEDARCWLPCLDSPNVKS